MQGAMQGVTVVHSPECPNCRRFLDGLRRTALAGSARVVDVSSLSPPQLAHVRMVPCVFAGGGAYQGTEAFKWLDQVEAAPPESFAGFDDGFSSFDGSADAETLNAASRGYGLF